MGERAGMSWVRAGAWGAYLACSWTWCIGMFLPLLLVRDLGAAGWWAFAIPNVVGAAAMGWVLRSSAAAGRLRARHWRAARGFSIVTVAFHAYFLGWMGGSLLPMEVVPPALLVAMLLAAGALWLRERVAWVAAALWVFSAAVLGVVLWEQPGAVRGALAARGELAATDVLWMAPVCAFGFALCPYLDLTFLRARGVCEGRTGAAAFTVGFGVMFASMIVLTLGYAGLFDAEVASRGLLERPLWAMLATVHIALQLAFTVAVHVVELAAGRGNEPSATTVAALGDSRAEAAGRENELGVDRTTVPPKPGTVVAHHPGAVVAGEPGAMSAVVLLLACLGSAVAGAMSRSWPDVAALMAGEAGYRAFMAAYGLVFPAYVWVCVVPRERVVGREAMLAAWAAGVVAASPFFAAGFLWRESVWLAPGLLVVLTSRWWVRSNAPGA